MWSLMDLMDLTDLTAFREVGLSASPDNCELLESTLCGDSCAMALFQGLELIEIIERIEKIETHRSYWNQTRDLLESFKCFS